MGNSLGLVVDSETFYKIMTQEIDPQGKQFVILDVRRQDEIDKMSIQSLMGDKNKLQVLFCGINIFEQMNKEEIINDVGIHETSSVLCMCAGGVRSEVANQHLRSLGFDSFNVEGGIWALAEYIKQHK